MTEHPALGALRERLVADGLRAVTVEQVCEPSKLKIARLRVDHPRLDR